MSPKSTDNSQADPPGPVGYVLRKLTHFDGTTIHQLRLLLPQEVMDEAEERARHQQAVNALGVATIPSDDPVPGSIANPVKGAPAAQEPRACKAVSSPAEPKRSTGPYSELDTEVEREFLRMRAQAVARRPQRSFERVLKARGALAMPCVPVYAWDDPLQLILRKGSTPDREVHKRNKEIYLKLATKGHLRTMGYPLREHDQVLASLEQLRQQMPHFGGVLDLVRESLNLSFARQKPMAIPPLLLLGPPGIGKTHFTHALAKALRIPVRRHGFDSGVTDAALLGNDKHWANTTFGLVFDMVALGDSASPIVLLDEIDKARCNDQVNALAPLHVLLEPVTAKAVRDISVDMEVDASHIVWIATANEPWMVPAPVRSRFREFTIEAPTGEAALKAAQVVAAAVHQRMGAELFDPPGPRIVSAIAHLSAREQIQALEQGYGRALASGRRVIARHDLPPDMLMADLDGEDPGSGAGGTPSGAWLH